MTTRALSLLRRACVVPHGHYRIPNGRKPESIFTVRDLVARTASSSTSSSERRATGDDDDDDDDRNNSRSVGRFWNGLSELSKARLSALVVSTTSIGFLAAGAGGGVATGACACVGTALCSSSASTLNQIAEVDRDRRMRRTRRRPLPSGAWSPRAAAALAAATGLSGGAALWWGTDPVTTALGVGNVALYAGVYTHLKPRSEINTWVGAVVGAVPPVMGWTAATAAAADDLSSTTAALAEADLAVPSILAATLYLWQFPHFFALSWTHRADYARGGFAMVPQNDPDGTRTAALINRYAWYLTAVPFAAAALDVTSVMFAVEGAALNAYALYAAREFGRERTNANARRVFRTSLWYLPTLLALFVLHGKVWRRETEENAETIDTTDTKETETYYRGWRERIRAATDYGRSLCVHEKVVQRLTSEKEDEENKENEGKEMCALVVGRNKATAAVQEGVRNVATVASQLEETTTGAATTTATTVNESTSD